MQVQMTSFPVEVLTEDFQASGLFTLRGNPAIFMNDQAVSAFEITEATLMPLVSGARIGEMQVSEVYIPKSEVQVMLIGEFGPGEAGLRPKPLKLVVFTSTFAIRGIFHVGAETGAADVFAAPGPFFPATSAEIFAIRPLAHEIQGQSDLLFIHKAAVRAYYEVTG